MPTVPQPSVEAVHSSAPMPSGKVGREGTAYAILLWQRGLPKSQLDLEVYERELEEIIGKDTLKQLAALPKQEQEKHRFAAERMYAASRSLKAEVHTSELQSHVNLVCRLLLENTQAAKGVTEIRRVKHPETKREICCILK